MKYQSQRSMVVTPNELMDNSQDIAIAKLKGHAFEVKQKLRDYENLNAQYLELQSRFQQLQDEQKRDGTGYQSYVEQVQNGYTSMQREIEELENFKLSLINKQDSYQNDLNGLKKQGNDYMKLLESKKRDYHRIVDIGHMLSMEIKETK